MTAPPQNSEARLTTGRRDDKPANGTYAGSNGSQVINRGEIFADADAEKIVLASMLNGNSNGEFPAARLFYYPSNQVIHRAIADLKLRGVPVDILTLTETLRESGELENAGGAHAVTSLTDELFYGKSPDIVNYMLERLHELHAKREARRIADQLKKGEMDIGDAQETIGGAHAGALQASSD
jgi:replicative DNA helicase